MTQTLESKPTLYRLAHRIYDERFIGACKSKNKKCFLIIDLSVIAASGHKQNQTSSRMLLFPGAAEQQIISGTNDAFFTDRCKTYSALAPRSH